MTPRTFAIKIAHRINILRSINTTTIIDGIYVPILGETGYALLHSTEPWLAPILRVLLQRRSGAFIDVGANIGQTLLTFASLREGHAYVGFEPNPYASAYIQELIQRNAFEFARVLTVGLSDEPQVLPIHLRSDYDSGGSVVEGFRDPCEYTQQRDVVVLNGDAVLQQMGIGPIGVIKIDVEGAELEVLSGLRNPIAANRPFIFCEILPVYDEVSKIGRFRRERANRIEQMLFDHDYHLMQMVHDGTVRPIRRIETHGDLALSDYFFYPEEDEASLMALLSDYIDT